jgi:hypothetical protein
MLPLFDMMMNAQNGNAVGEMAKQYGLAQEQMVQAMSALMPAFSTGLKRTAANPYDFSNLMTTAASGNYTQYFDDLSKAFTPQGLADGNSALGKIFGSKEVSRAVAAQAAQMSGIGQDVYKQMMPVIANAMVGGVFKQMAEQFQAAGEAIAAGRPNDYVNQWLQGTRLQEKPKDPIFDNPFAQSFQAFFNQATKVANPQSDPAKANPFMQMFETMMAAAAPAAANPPPTEPKPAPENTAFSALFGQMFDSGIEVQKNYQKSMDGIFENYLASFKPQNKA